MLTRRAAAAFLSGLLCLAAPATPAHAGPPVGDCPPPQLDCNVVGNLPSQPGNGGTGGGQNTGGGGPRTCTWAGQTVPCTLDGLGWFNSADGCYYRQVPAPSGDPHNGQGAWYVATCGMFSGNLSVRLPEWRATPPPGFGPTPEELAQQALAKIRLLGADIGITPDPGGTGLVGLPVWMWTTVNANTWGPITASASAGGLTVTITGHATKIDWDMGDGHVVSCDNPGTPYRADYGGQQSPTCGYVVSLPNGQRLTGYQQSSRTKPGGVYRITAITTWRVDWAGGGVSGVITTTRQSQTTIRVDELQVVTS